MHAMQISVCPAMASSKIDFFQSFFFDFRCVCICLTLMCLVEFLDRAHERSEEQAYNIESCPIFGQGS